MGSHLATRRTLERWTAELGGRFAERFPGPGDITAFRDGFAVHGRFGQPCPTCGQPVGRICYADSETNYCPACQTGGRVLADRSMSRLLKDDWPRRIEDRPAGGATVESPAGSMVKARGPSSRKNAKGDRGQ